MSVQFTKAKRTMARLRLALLGPSGAGKTYTALRFAHRMGGRIALIDTEFGSGSLYAGVQEDGIAWDFDTLMLADFSPARYIEAIQAAQTAKYNTLIIDSLSHAWAGAGGLLDLRDKAAPKFHGNTWAAFRDVTPLHRQMIDTMLRCNMHLIVTMRSKMAYVQTQDDDNRTVVKKVGLQPVQREDMEYEFTIVAEMDVDHNLWTGKTRVPTVDHWQGNRPGVGFIDPVIAWMNSAEASDNPTGAPVEYTQQQPPVVMQEQPTTNGTSKPTPPAVAGNGKKSDKVDKAPTNRRELLTYVNARVQVPYDEGSDEGSLAHMFRSIRKIKGPDWNYPTKANDEGGWLAAAQAAIDYAQSKVTQPEPEQPEQPELPTS